MKKELILITGGAGFIGSHTADFLADKGFKIRILDNLQSSVHTKGIWPKYVQKKGFELMKGDVREKKVWERALKGVSYVYHLAAHQDQHLDFSTFFETNTVSTALLYEVIVEQKLPIKKVIVASSQFVYGDGRYQLQSTGKLFYPDLRSLMHLEAKRWEIAGPDGKEQARFVPFAEYQELRPTNAYGLSKVALEQLSLRFGKTHAIPTVVVRYSVVQGPRQSPKNIYSGALRIFVTQALLGEPITVYEDGRQMRDFVNVEDVALANYVVLKDARAEYEIFNIGGGEGYQVSKFAQMVKQIAGSKSEISIGGFRRTDTRHAVSNIEKMKRLGWMPKHNPEKSILDYVEWIKEEKLEKTLKKGLAKQLKKEGIVSGKQ